MEDHGGAILTKTLQEAGLQPREELQVYHKHDNTGNWGNIIKITDTQIHVSWHRGKIKIYDTANLPELKTLMIASADIHFDGGIEWIWFPLKYSCWQSAIDNNEIHNPDKPVRFILELNTNLNQQEAVVIKE